MTHVGQLAMLRRLARAPVPPEDFSEAEITAERVGSDQPAPKRPDPVWPEAPSGWVPRPPQNYLLRLYRRRRDARCCIRPSRSGLRNVTTPCPVVKCPSRI